MTDNNDTKITDLTQDFLDELFDQFNESDDISLFTDVLNEYRFVHRYGDYNELKEIYDTLVKNRPITMI